MLDSMHVIGLALARPNALLTRQLGESPSHGRRTPLVTQVVG